MTHSPVACSGEQPAVPQNSNALRAASCARRGHLQSFSARLACAACVVFAYSRADSQPVRQAGCAVGSAGRLCCWQCRQRQVQSPAGPLHVHWCLPLLLPGPAVLTGQVSCDRSWHLFEAEQAASPVEDFCFQKTRGVGSAWF